MTKPIECYIVIIRRSMFMHIKIALINSSICVRILYVVCTDTYLRVHAYSKSILCDLGFDSCLRPYNIDGGAGRFRWRLIFQ